MLVALFAAFLGQKFLWTVKFFCANSFFIIGIVLKFFRFLIKTPPLSNIYQYPYHYTIYKPYVAQEVSQRGDWMRMLSLFTVNFFKTLITLNCCSILSSSASTQLNLVTNKKQEVVIRSMK